MDIDDIGIYWIMCWMMLGKRFSEGFLLFIAFYAERVYCTSKIHENHENPVSSSPTAETCWNYATAPAATDPAADALAAAAATIPPTRPSTATRPFLCVVNVGIQWWMRWHGLVTSLPIPPSANVSEETLLSDSASLFNTYLPYPSVDVHVINFKHYEPMFSFI